MNLNFKKNLYLAINHILKVVACPTCPDMFLLQMSAKRNYLPIREFFIRNMSSELDMPPIDLLLDYFSNIIYIKTINTAINDFYPHSYSHKITKSLNQLPGINRTIRNNTVNPEFEHAFYIFCSIYCPGDNL